jgi:ribosome-binding protein aMBF1 (putative translation factor)
MSTMARDPIERLRRAGKPITAENLLAEVDIDIEAENRDRRPREIFEQRLRQARTDADLSQAALGELVDVRDKEINRWEHASKPWGVMPNPQHRRSLAHALGIPVAYLWPETEIDE